MIVEAVGVCVMTFDPAKVDYAARLQQAMTTAVEVALSEGISPHDAVELKRRMEAAREIVNVV